MSLDFSTVQAAADAQRLTSCITGDAGPTGNRAHEAVSRVEHYLLQKGWPVGEALGALPEVQKGLGLGRPACREAIVILEARGSLNVQRGPGGGLFVAAPTVDDVVWSMLMYLAINRVSGNCIQEFRLLVWRMVAEAAIARGIRVLRGATAAEELGFAGELARLVGNPAISLAVSIAEQLAHACKLSPAPKEDVVFERAIRAGNRGKAFARLDDLAQPMESVTPLLALEAIEHAFGGSGRKAAMALAARMVRERIYRPEKLEAEWETSERLGFSNVVVRQARRILQDFGAVRCQRGRKGAVWAGAASPAGVIRLLAPCLFACGAGPQDNGEAANFLACNAPRLAAARVASSGPSQASVVGTLVDSRELLDLLEIENLLLAASGNPLLSITTRALGLATLTVPGASIGLQRRQEIVDINHRLLEAIEAGDTATADSLARAKGELQQSESTHRKLA